MSRRSVLKSGARVGGALAFGTIGLGGRGRGQSAGIPTVSTLYQIRVVGQTSAESFDREGQFLVTPPAGPTQSYPRDIGLTSGQPHVGEGGAIDFVTNTALRPVLDMGGSPTLDGAAVQVGSVEANEQSGLLEARPIGDQGVDLPPGVRAGLQVNIFNAQSGIVASIYEVIGGFVQIQFQGGNQIAGNMDFVGVSLTGAGQARLVAQFAGTAIATA